MENQTQPPQSPAPAGEENELAVLKQKLKLARLENQLALELAKNGAQDFETAALVAKSRMKTSGTTDVKQIVKTIRDEKPFLFSSSTPLPKRTQPVKTAVAENSAVVEAAKRASQNGSRQDVLEYMRTRRGS